MSDALVHIRQTILNAEIFTDIFGSVKDAPELKMQYRRLVKMVHPDGASEEDQALAGEVFFLLKNVWERAREALATGAYNAPLKRSTLRSRADTYELYDGLYYTGSFSRTYRGESKEHGQVLIKVASKPIYNPQLNSEVEVLRKLYDIKMGQFVPNFRETFAVGDDDGRSFTVTVFDYREDYLSVEQILEAFPGGLPPEHAAWICRRVMAQTLPGKAIGYVHGAITPDHVLVHPITHEPIHIGWAHSVKKDGRITSIVDKWKAYYPPEVFDKKPVNHRTDVYMAAQTCFALFGGPKNTPKPIFTILSGCTTHRRYNGKDALAALTMAVRKLWGRVYRPLNIKQ